MNEKIKQEKKRAIAKAKENFLGPTRLADINYGDSCFFEDIALWVLRPMRLFLDAMDEKLERLDGFEERDPEAFKLLLNDVEIKLDDLIDACDRWSSEENESRQKQKAA